MRKTIGVTLMLLCFIFAASFNFNYLHAKKKSWKISLSLEKVIIESQPGGEQKSLEANGNNCSDDFMQIQWSPAPKRFDFVLTNKTGSPLTIIWEKSLFVDEKGIEHNVIIENVKFSESPKPIPPTTIAPKGKIKNMVYPRDYAVLTPKLEVVQDFVTKATTSYEKKEWVKKEIFLKKIKLKQMKMQNKDFDIETYWQKTRYRVILALKINGKETNYHFFFKPMEK